VIEQHARARATGQHGHRYRWPEQEPLEVEPEPRPAQLAAGLFPFTPSVALHASASGAGSPTMRTSGSSRTPNLASTSACACRISHSMSAAVAPPRFTMKFACLAEIEALPRTTPLRPAASTS